MSFKRLLSLFLLVVSFQSSHICLFAADVKYDVGFYDRWTGETSQELTDKAVGYTDSNMPDSALVCYTIVANRYIERQLEGEELSLAVSAMANLGYLYCNCYFDYQKSYSYLRQALDIAERNKLKKQLSYIYLNLGVLYATYEELSGHESYSKETLYYLHKAYEMSVATKDIRVAMYCLNNILDVKFSKSGKVDKEYQQLKSLVPRRSSNLPLYEYTRFMCLGMMAYADGKYVDALKCFVRMEKTLGSHEKGNSDMFRFKAMQYRASALFALKKNAEALALLDSIACEAESKDMQHVKVWIYKILYEHFSSTNDSVLSDRYQLKYLKSKESLSQSGHVEDVNKMRFLYQLKTVNDKVKDLSRDREKQRVVFVSGLAIAVVVIIGLLLLLRYYHRQRNYIQTLYDKNMALLQMKEKSESEVTDNKYQNSGLDDNSKNELLMQISKVMSDVGIICSPDFSIKQLCDIIGSNTTYVSQVINEKYGMNFKTYLNEQRVAEACRRLNDFEHYGNYTIEAIAVSVGFKSRTNFALVFKRVTGLSASEFQRAAHKKA